MHTSNLPSGRVAHHNGDFSGDVRFVLPEETVIRIAQPDDNKYFVDIPFNDLLALVAEHIRDQQISRIESVPPRILLGLEP